jgi:hypothetical protein
MLNALLVTLLPVCRQLGNNSPADDPNLAT